MNTVPAHELLARLFEVIVEEAKKRPEFADALLGVFPEAIIAKIEKPGARGKAPAFDATSLHAVNILRQHGEQTLRGRLSQVTTKKDLIAIAKYSGVQLPKSATSKGATLDDVIEGIILGAKHYDSQRKAAAAA